MKYSIKILGALLIIFLFSGCSLLKSQITVDRPPTPTISGVVKEIEQAEFSEIENFGQKLGEEMEMDRPGISLYRGNYFDIQYPENFQESPTQLVRSGEISTAIQTDEAIFTAPDSSVEFFVYSPLWSGEPKNYLNILDTEKLVSEKNVTSTLPNRFYKYRSANYTTVKANDDSYYRSFVEIVDKSEDQTTLNKVFGIKYKNAESYETYKDEYIKFKQSLRQYAD